MTTVNASPLWSPSKLEEMSPHAHFGRAPSDVLDSTIMSIVSQDHLDQSIVSATPLWNPPRAREETEALDETLLSVPNMDITGPLDLEVPEHNYSRHLSPEMSAIQEQLGLSSETSQPREKERKKWGLRNMLSKGTKYKDPSPARKSCTIQ